MTAFIVYLGFNQTFKLSDFKGLLGNRLLKTGFWIKLISQVTSKYSFGYFTLVGKKKKKRKWCGFNNFVHAEQRNKAQTVVVVWSAWAWAPTCSWWPYMVSNLPQDGHQAAAMPSKPSPVGHYCLLSIFQCFVLFSSLESYTMKTNPIKPAGDVGEQLPPSCIVMRLTRPSVMAIWEGESNSHCCQHPCHPCQHPFGPQHSGMGPQLRFPCYKRGKGIAVTARLAKLLMRMRLSAPTNGISRHPRCCRSTILCQASEKGKKNESRVRLELGDAPHLLTD